jgi:hypothetical protein
MFRAYLVALLSPYGILYINAMLVRLLKKENKYLSPMRNKKISKQ